MYSLSIKETQDVMSIVGREIQLTKDYTTGNATFKQGRRGTVIEAIIKGCDLQLYEGVAFSPMITLNHRQRKTLLNTNKIIYRVCVINCLLYTSPSPRDNKASRMPSAA